MKARYLALLLLPFLIWGQEAIPAHPVDPAPQEVLQEEKLEPAQEQVSAVDSTAEAPQPQVPQEEPVIEETTQIENPPAKKESEKSTVNLSVDTTKTTVVSEEGVKKTGAGGGPLFGFTFLDMKEVIKVIESDSDTNFPIDHIGFQDEVNNMEIAPSYGGMGFYQFANGLRLGGTFRSSFRSWRLDDSLTPDTSVTMLYTNNYIGVLLEGTFGTEKDRLIIGTNIGAGASTLSFYQGFEKEGMWWTNGGRDDNYGKTKTAVSGFFMTEIHVGYMHSFSRIFHMGFDANGVFQASAYGYSRNYDTNQRYTSFHPGFEMRFIFGTKG